MGASSFHHGILYLLRRPSAVYVAPLLRDSALHSLPPSLLLLPVSTATALMSKGQKTTKCIFFSTTKVTNFETFDPTKVLSAARWFIFMKAIGICICGNTLLFCHTKVPCRD